MNSLNGDYAYGSAGGQRAPPRLGPGSSFQTGGAPGRPGIGAPQPNESNQSRAARYEDEKRRIIDSCFSKQEADGTLLESYITHVRVTEDAMYPSTPPPPDAAASNKKSRLILVAVRKSGRVRVHKARENPSGSFSIGKTWPLDDLSAIHIYAGVNPANERDRVEQQWAGDLGFTVVLGKPYYWHAPTSKEKDFFIASLLKIYKKYTGGRVPELTGFLPHQLEQFGASPAVPAANAPAPQSPSMQRFSPIPPPRFDQQQAPQHAPPARADLRASARDSPSALVPDPLRSPARTERRIPSRENMPRPLETPPGGLLTPGDAPPMPLVPRQPQTPKADAQRQAPTSSSPHSSQTSVDARGRQAFPPTGSQPGPDARERPGLPASVRPPNGLPVPKRPSQDQANASTDFLPTSAAIRSRSRSSAQSSERPTTATSDALSTAPPLPPSDTLAPPATLAPPERKRPFTPRTDPNGAQSNESSRFVTPATTPNTKKEDPPELPTEPQELPQPAAPAKADYFNAVTLPAPQASERKTSESTAPLSKDVPPDSSITSQEKTAEPEEMTSDNKAGEESTPTAPSMLKKKNAADTFRRAALAINAFKPRQGGGAARLKAMQDEGKKGNEPDGITGVVPAPLMRGMSADSVGNNQPATPGTPSGKDPLATPPPAATAPRVAIQRTATEDSVPSAQSPPAQPSAESPAPRSLLDAPAIKEVPVQPVQEPARPPTPEKARSRSPQRRKRQRQEQDIAKYASSLGLDPRILDGRGADFTDLLTEFGWQGRLDAKRKVDHLEADVRREIGRAQASGWLGHIEQQDTKLQELANAFDRAIDECEELDGLFTLYAHELDTLAADIEYIEAQSQGLQVQTANQKLLQKELQSLLSTLRISHADLQDLHHGSLADPPGVARVEQALTTLYRALITIDPNIRQNRQRREGHGSHADRSGIGVYADTELGQMRAVREKKDEYAEQSNAFIRRFSQHMNAVFTTLEQTRDDEAPKPLSSDATVSPAAHRIARQELWLYNGVMLFVREVNSYEWKTLIKSYEMNVRGSYQEHFRAAAMAARREARKPTGDEQEALFTYQEKDKADESLTSSAARKLTVRRGKTVKTTGIKPAFGARSHDGKPLACEVFQSLLEQQSQVIAEEQNFMVTFFHLSSQTTADFAELVSSRPPQERPLPNLAAKIPFEPDKNISATITASIDAIYAFWLGDLQGQLEWVLKQDQLQGVGVLCALEHVMTNYDDTNQEFITTTVRTLHTRLAGLFHKFVDEQVKAVEETKVKLKKRKGIISFMRTFPLFTAAVENMIPAPMVQHEHLEIRFILNDAYTKILRAMWESLTFIAKDDSAGTTGHSAAPTSGDPEDKEALNYRILLIENMNHFVEEVDTHQNLVLEEWKEKASNDMFTHLSQYTDAVIRRPLGKWLDFVESTEAMMKTADSYHSVSSKPSHSRSTCKKIVKSHDAAEIRKGIETLKKRVEKHFGEVDDPTTMSKSLITRVLDECNARYAHAWDRMKVIIDKVYDGSLEIDWRKDEVSALFKR